MRRWGFDPDTQCAIGRINDFTQSSNVIVRYAWYWGRRGVSDSSDLASGLCAGTVGESDCKYREESDYPAEGMGVKGARTCRHSATSVVGKLNADRRNQSS